MILNVFAVTVCLFVVPRLGTTVNPVAADIGVIVPDVLFLNTKVSPLKIFTFIIFDVRDFISLE